MPFFSIQISEFAWLAPQQGSDHPDPAAEHPATRGPQRSRASPPTLLSHTGQSRTRLIETLCVLLNVSKLLSTFKKLTIQFPSS